MILKINSNFKIHKRILASRNHKNQYNYQFRKEKKNQKRITKKFP